MLGCPLGLPLSSPSAVWAQAPSHSVELPLGLWPGAKHWGEACSVLGGTPKQRQLYLCHLEHLRVFLSSQDTGFTFSQIKAPKHLTSEADLSDILD
jgi:hypothetical protein